MVDAQAGTATQNRMVTSPRQTATLAVTIAATLVVMMDYSAALTTLVDTAHALAAGPAAQTWILNSMPLGLSVLLLISGSLADDHGRKRVFIAGAFVLAAALAVSAIATDALAFVLARIVEGAASAAIIATSLALIAHAFPSGRSRRRAMALWGAAIGLGIAIGPVAGGLLVSVHWSAEFWLFAVLALVIALFAVPALTESRNPSRVHADVPGTITLGLGIAALLGALTEGRNDWSDPLVLVLGSAGVVLLIGFAAIQARVRRPLLELSLFRNPAFVTSTLGALITGVAVIGLISYLPAMLQRTAGVDALGTAGLFVVWSGTAAVVAYLSSGWVDRAGSQLAAGFVVSAIGVLAMLGALESARWAQIIIGLGIAGVGSGLINGALPRLAVDSVPAHRAAMGSGANNAARYLGSSIGVAVMVPIISTGFGSVEGVDIALIVSAAVTLLGAVAVLALQRRTPA